MSALSVKRHSVSLFKRGAVAGINGHIQGVVKAKRFIFALINAYAHGIKRGKKRLTAASHRLGGLAAGVALASFLHTDPVGSGVVLAASMLGCLLPDIDNRQSAISYKFKVARFFVTVGQTVLRGISYLFPKKQKRYIRSLIGHRGLSHSLAPVVILPLIVISFGKITGSLQIAGYIAAGTAAGILSHLFFDMFSGGVPLLMPFSVKRVTLAHIKTGGVVEWFFRIALIVVFCYFGLIKEVIPWQRLLRL